MIWFIKLLYQRIFRRAAYKVLMGREIERGCPERGRLLRGDVDAMLERTWQNFDEIVAGADIENVPTLGNRHNVLLAAATVAAYRSFTDSGIERDYAMELCADVGWKVYIHFLPVPRAIARLLARDPQRRMNLILGMFMTFPFSAPGRPAYECEAWAEEGRFCTNWTHCPPFAFVEGLVARQGDRGEVEAFRRSWCAYDWALAYAMVDGGDRRGGSYERPHTLSAGDDVCDMVWSAETPPLGPTAEE